MLDEITKFMQLKIYYYFMHADGELSDAEYAFLDDITKKMQLRSEPRKAFHAFCEKGLSKSAMGNPKEVNKLIDIELKDEGCYELRNDKTAQAETLWNLVNLGYADGQFTPDEREVIDHLAKIWKVDELLIEEFVDTAEAILALTKQKEWAQLRTKPDEEIAALVEKLDKERKSLTNNIKITIKEIELDFKEPQKVAKS